MLDVVIQRFVTFQSSLMDDRFLFMMKDNFN